MPLTNCSRFWSLSAGIVNQHAITADVWVR